MEGRDGLSRLVSHCTHQRRLRIYALDAEDRLLVHSYGSGNRDSASYIGQCCPCNTVVRDVVSEANGLGLSGANAEGEDDLINPVYRDNMGGIVPNSLDGELLAIRQDAYAAGNQQQGRRADEDPGTPWVG
jgi:hypothetical protein